MRSTFLAAAATLVAAPLVALAAPAATAAVPSDLQVTFTGETPGGKPNGYAAASAPNVRFYDTNGSGNLLVGDFGTQSNGVGIASLSGATEIRLTSPTNRISMSFGDDDPGFLDATAQARLTAYRGATKLGTVLKNVNANDVMDQTISFEDRLFNRVVFEYVDAAEVPIPNLPEVVDDITVAPLCTVLGTPNNDNLAGTVGSDVLCGDDGIDTLDGVSGDDLVIGGAGNDVVRGGPGNDRLVGGPGRDRLDGGAGNDSFNGGKQRDRCVGGPGTDVANSCEVKIGFP